jgi:hypothetical protein
MLCFCKNISKNFAIEISLFHKLRIISDGVTFFNLDICLDLYKGEHLQYQSYHYMNLETRRK